MEKDPEAARAEWLGEFREDLEAAFTLEALEACVIKGRDELPASSLITYRAFVDPSGGKKDAFTLGISHKEDERAVLDCLKVWPAPFDPAVVVDEAAEVLKAYGCVSVTGDNYAGEWPVSYFRQRGIDYHKAEKAKSELYLAMIPAVNSKQVELPDNRQLIDELRKLERRRGRTGKDTIDHPANGHDDIANAAAGVCWLILSDALGDESLGGFHPGRHVTSDALRVRGPIYIGLSLEPFTAAVAQLGNGDTLQFLHAVLGPALHSVLRELQTWLNLHARMVKRTGIYPETEDWHLMEQIEAAMPGVWQVSCAGEDGARQRLLKALDEYNPLGEPRLTISRGVRFLPEALARKHDKGTPLSALAYAAALVVDHVNPGAPPPGPPLTVNTYFNPTAPYDPRRRGW